MTAPVDETIAHVPIPSATLATTRLAGTVHLRWPSECQKMRTIGRTGLASCLRVVGAAGHRAAPAGAHQRRARRRRSPQTTSDSASARITATGVHAASAGGSSPSSPKVSTKPSNVQQTKPSTSPQSNANQQYSNR